MDIIQPRFRLRNKEKIVGYLRKVSDSMVLYSRDSFWWTGRKIVYDEIDEWIGLKDKNGRYIYEWDILYYKIDPGGGYHKGAVLWEAREEIFGIRDIEEDIFIPLAVNGVKMFNERQLQVFSHLFINPDLMKKLGVEE